MFNSKIIHLTSVLYVATIIVTCANPGDPEQNAKLLKAATDGNLEAVKEALKNGASVTAVNEHKHTALHRATMSANPEVTRYLVEMGADVDAQDKNGDSPVNNAAGAKGEHLSILIAKNPDVNNLGWGDHSPLMNAADSGAVENVKLLIKNGADVKFRNGNGYTALVLCKTHRLSNTAAYREVARILLDAGAEDLKPDDLDM